MKHQAGQVISQRVKPRRGVDQRIAQPGQRLIAHEVADVAEHPAQSLRVQTLDGRIPQDARLVVPCDKVRLQHTAENPEREERQQQADK